MNPPAIPVSAPPPRNAMRPLWAYSLGNAPRGLMLVREKGWTLAWDEKHWLYLLNATGELQSQKHIPGELVTACCADDGSAYAMVGGKGEICWLAPDLMPRWERTTPNRATALALDPLGQYLAVADLKGALRVFDRLGRPVCQAESPRPMHHLAFVPSAPVLLGASDYGLVVCFDLSGRSLWRDGLVAHIGSLTVNGDGDSIVLACFTEGLQRYDLKGKRLPKYSASWPCRLASQSFDGRYTLVAWLTKQLLLLDANGQNLCAYPLDKAIVALALAPLADSAVVALAEGPVIGLEVRKL